MLNLSPRHANGLGNHIHQMRENLTAFPFVVFSLGLSLSPRFFPKGKPPRRLLARRLSGLCKVALTQELEAWQVFVQWVPPLDVAAGMGSTKVKCIGRVHVF